LQELKDLLDGGVFCVPQQQVLEVAHSRGKGTKQQV
jgi:hypothetical protein